MNFTCRRSKNFTSCLLVVGDHIVKVSQEAFSHQNKLIMKSHPNPNRNLQSSADMIQASTDESDDDLPIISIKPAAAAVDHPGPMSDPPSKNKSQNSSSIRKWWLSLVYLLTFCIPSLCLRRCFRNLQTEIAWREKIVWVCYFDDFISNEYTN